MRILPLLPLLLAASCASPPRSGAPAAPWSVDEESNLALAHCPKCRAMVPHDGHACPDCGASYQIEPKTIPCPQCDGSGKDAAVCEACQGSGRCAICDGEGTFQGKPCPECEGSKHCPDCAEHDHASGGACPNCAGKGTITLK